MAPERSRQVKTWNAATLAELEKQPGFADYRAKALALLSTNQKIAEPDQILGDKVLNFWQDEQHPRGMWRVSPLAAFASGKPQWRTLLDIDAMSKADNKKWVFKGADCLSPAYVDCMVSLSNGGGDAVEVREFDLDKAAFIPGGFFLPNAKSNIAWAGPDALFVGTDFGAGTLTDSGYPRIVKLWRRGTPLSSARPSDRGRRKKRRLGCRLDARRRQPRPGRSRPRGRFLSPQDQPHRAGGRLIPSPLPEDAEHRRCARRPRRRLAQDAVAGPSAGTLVAYSIPDLLAGKAPAIETVFVPNEHQAVEEVSASKSKLWVKYLEDVSGRLTALAGHRTAHGAAARSLCRTSPRSTSMRRRARQTWRSRPSKAC